MSSGHSYDTYKNWINVPLFLGSGSTLFSIVAILVAVIVAVKVCNYAQIVEYLVKPLYLFAKVTFGDHIKEIENSDKFTFYYYEVLSVHICMLSTITSVVLGPTFYVFLVIVCS